MSVLSVVIPTYNRSTKLQLALSAYMQQTVVKSINEILVIDDGSDDETHAIVAGLKERSSVPIKYFRQENKGPAAARNVGIRVAESEVILFTDDDIIPGPTLVEEHLCWHNRYSEPSTAVLGYVTWAPEVKPTPFMQWYGLDGALFSYAHTGSRTELDYRFFYTCNLSLKTQFLRLNGLFDEEFKSAAFEDIELGYRLGKVGMRLLFNRNAIAFHHQHFGFREACQRVTKAAEARKVFQTKEAGRSFYSAQQTGRPKILSARVRRQTKEYVSRILSPFAKFVDGNIPLPWIVYRAMFRLMKP